MLRRLSPEPYFLDKFSALGYAELSDARAHFR